MSDVEGGDGDTAHSRSGDDADGEGGAATGLRRAFLGRAELPLQDSLMAADGGLLTLSNPLWRPLMRVAGGQVRLKCQFLFNMMCARSLDYPLPIWRDM
jgi:hypothetical protein